MEFKDTIDNFIIPPKLRRSTHLNCVHCKSVTEYYDNDYKCWHCKKYAYHKNLKIVFNNNYNSFG